MDTMADWPTKLWYTVILHGYVIHILHLHKKRMQDNVMHFFLNANVKKNV